MARPVTPDFASIRGLVPTEVAVEESRIDAVVGYAWPEELAHVASAVESRRREFAAGRILAARALASLGCAACPILAGPDRAPIWPAGFTGSISHTHEHVAVAVGRTDGLLAIGIDIEDAGRFRPDLEHQILRPEEIAANLTGLPPDRRQSVLALLFSIKEAFYKCQYVISQQFLGFHDARTTIDFTRQSFELTLLVTVPPLADDVFHGKFQMRSGGVATAMVLRNNGRPWSRRP
jgi:4'-phosphopantetheinyl transferase EntD